MLFLSVISALLRRTYELVAMDNLIVTYLHYISCGLAILHTFMCAFGLYHCGVFFGGIVHLVSHGVLTH